MNVYDSRIIAAILTRNGYKETDIPENADIVIVNTCSVREHAEQRAIGRITSLHALRKENPELLIGVVGCMAQNLKEQVPEADFVVGPSNYRELPSIVEMLGETGDRRQPQRH
jgi:tRNA-2-methylthio-N6-dimethylallyladenosine synthase